VVYGTLEEEYAAIVENVTDTQVTVRTVPGVGTGAIWKVTVGGQEDPTPPLELTSSYGAPYIESLSPLDGVSLEELTTQGGQQIIVHGLNFGRVTDPVTVTYGAGTLELVASCVKSDTSPHTDMTCTTAPGAGGGDPDPHHWIAVVAGSISPESDAVTRYIAPVLLEVTGPGSFDASTRGSEQVVLTGLNFGPASLQSVITHSAVYGGAVPSPDEFEYVATECTVTADHTVSELLW
jgi:hypothetical protein